MVSVATSYVLPCTKSMVLAGYPWPQREESTVPVERRRKRSDDPIPVLFSKSLEKTCVDYQELPEVVTR